MSELDYRPKSPPAPMERNPDTWKKHRRDVTLQIWLPLGIGVLLTTSCATLVAIGSLINLDVSQLADASLIWLIAPMLIATFIMFIIIAAFAYGMARLLKVLPFYTRRVQDFFILAKERVAIIMDRMVDPIITYKTRRASWMSFRSNIGRKQTK